MYVEQLIKLEYIIKPCKESFNWDKASQDFNFFRCILYDIVTYLTEAINESMSASLIVQRFVISFSIDVNFYLL